MTLRRTPQDFLVEELPEPSLLESIAATPAAVTLYRLSKTNLTTPDACDLVARALRQPREAIQIAGLKDRHGSTTQHISVQPQASASLPRSLRGRNWSLERLGWRSEPLSSSDVRGNRFQIIVRQLTRRRCDEMDEAAGLLQSSDEPSTLRFVNYFGDQRFGSARHGRGFLARHLIRGEFEAALRLAIATPSSRDAGPSKRLKKQIDSSWGRWSELLAKLPRSPHRRVIEHLAKNEADFAGAFAKLPAFFQLMCVEAYQSHLWNAIARQLAEGVCESSERGIAADDPFGTLVFPAIADVPAELASINLPLLAPGTKLVDPWRAAAESILADEGIGVADLQIPGFRKPWFGEAPRNLFAAATNFSIGQPEPDELSGDATRFKRSVSFDLPRGAYATVLLRALGE